MVKEIVCIHITSSLTHLQLPCSYCTHSANAHCEGEQTLETSQNWETSNKGCGDLCWPYLIQNMVTVFIGLRFNLRCLTHYGLRIFSELWRSIIGCPCLPMVGSSDHLVSGC